MLLLLMFCVAWNYSGVPAAPRAAKRSTITKGKTTPKDDDDDVALHGGLTRANSKSCSLGFQRISLVVDIHVMVNWHLPNQVSADQYHVTISLAQVYSLLSTCVFLVDQVLVFDWIAGSCQVNSLWSVPGCLEAVNANLSKDDCFFLCKCFSLLLSHGLLV